jgi:hypothetical protein
LLQLLSHPREAAERLYTLLTFTATFELSVWSTLTRRPWRVAQVPGSMPSSRFHTPDTK